jgi:1,4-alpha-glucan branching enzyme
MPSKSYTKTRRVCRVTFTLPSEVGAETACVVGEFNDWDRESRPMKKRKDGSFGATVSLVPGTTYRYRFLLDGMRWENDWAAEGYVRNEFGTEDSVITV